MGGGVLGEKVKKNLQIPCWSSRPRQRNREQTENECAERGEGRGERTQSNKEMSEPWVSESERLKEMCDPINTELERPEPQNKKTIRATDLSTPECCKDLQGSMQVSEKEQKLRLYCLRS